MKRDFLHITDFTADEIHETFALAKEVKARFKNREDYKPFKDFTMAMIFAKPSIWPAVGYLTMSQHGSILQVINTL